MASGSLIGALRVTLGIDISEFLAGTSQARAEMRKFQREFAKQGKQMQAAGRDLTAFVTVPVVGLGVAVLKTAGDFEAGMNLVGISSKATAQQLEVMREQALLIGSETSKGATEAASAMDMLAKAGMSAKDIMEGGARAAVNLSIATGSDLDPAAAAVTDSMTLFKKTAKDLPEVINNITGAVNESKFDFQDFQMGMAQAGGVAASSGIQFDEFTAALAGTASQFGSGSDAGTSFKTFISSLVPATKEAAEMMAKYNLEFFDAEGRMKSLTMIAAMLDEKFSDMSVQDRNEAFKTMFGSDAIRTAIGLMELGSKGFEDMQKRIAETSATEQAAARMKGFNGQMEQLKGALETLAIRIADSGLLEFMTQFVTGLTQWVEWLGKASPETLKFLTIIVATAAALGPLALIFGTSIRLVGMLLPLLAKLGPVVTAVKTAFTYLLPVIMALGRALLATLISPLGLVVGAVTAVYLAWKHWDQIKAIVVRLYTAVKTYILDGLNSVWDGVKSKIDSVKGWFFGLYDAVVGHSYIPDMVDEIGQHMARLDANLVQPAQKGTEATKEAFLQMQQQVSAILSRLFPEQARSQQLQADMAALEKGMKAAGFTAEQTAEALRRLKAEYADDTVGKREGPAVVANDNPILSEDQVDDSIEKTNKDILATITDETKSKTAEMAQAWADMAQSAIYSLRNMVSSFKSGDILGGITELLGVISQVSGALFSTGITKGDPFSKGSDHGAIGFSTGGAFKVGGSGGVDSQLMRIRATPGEVISVDRTSQGRREPVIVKVQANDYFDAKVDSIASPLADNAAVRGTLGGAAMAERRDFRRRRGQLA